MFEKKNEKSRMTCEDCMHYIICGHKDHIEKVLEQVESLEIEKSKFIKITVVCTEFREIISMPSEVSSIQKNQHLGGNMPLEVLEVYDKKTNKTIDVKKDKYFRDYGVVIGLDGHMMLTQYGDIVCSVDERYYGVRLARNVDLKEAINVVINNLCVNDGECFFDCDKCQKAQKILKEFIDSKGIPLLDNFDN